MYKKNKRENAVIEKYVKQGYSFITKGYPDICFYKDNDIFFIEVKRKQIRPSTKMGLSIHQRKMHKIFHRLGLNLKIEYV